MHHSPIRGTNRKDVYCYSYTHPYLWKSQMETEKRALPRAKPKSEAAVSWLTTKWSIRRSLSIRAVPCKSHWRRTQSANWSWKCHSRTVCCCDKCQTDSLCPSYTTSCLLSRVQQAACSYEHPTTHRGRKTQNWTNPYTAAQPRPARHTRYTALMTTKSNSHAILRSFLHCLRVPFNKTASLFHSESVTLALSNPNQNRSSICRPRPRGSGSSRLALCYVETYPSLTQAS